MIAHLHLYTDMLSTVAAGLSGLAVRRWRPQLRQQAVRARATPVYWLVLAGGALFGAYWFGTLNILLSQAALPAVLQAGDGTASSQVGGVILGRSAFGAIFGAIAAIELYKKAIGQAGSTGAVFVIPLAVGMVVGRFGCQFSGLDDFTYGRPTDLPWGWDFGDGISRHPSPLYEIVAMAGFLLWFLWWSKRDVARAARIGFYVFVGYYSLQRFLVEFSKPYGGVLHMPVGWPDLDIFQIGAALLFVYAFWMIRRGDHAADTPKGGIYAGG